MVSAARYSAPRMAATDSPDFLNAAGATRSALTPAASARSKIVDPGCQLSGSTLASHLSALSRASAPGIAT